MEKYGEAVRLYETTTEPLRSIADRLGLQYNSVGGFVRRSRPDAIEAHNRLVEREEALRKEKEQAESAALALQRENEEKERILSALRQTGGNKRKAAKLLGFSKSTLYNKLNALGLNDTGVQQAQRAAPHVAAFGPTAVLSSPLQRASLTAQYIADACGIDVVQTDPRLEEINAANPDLIIGGKRFAEYTQTLSSIAPVLDLAPNVEATGYLDGLKHQTTVLGEVFGAQSAAERLNAEAAARRAPPGQAPEVQVRGDRRSAFDPVAQVVLACQRAGIARISFITEPQALR